LACSAVDLIISDIVMPGEMDGLALVRQVQDLYPAVAILLMSGYSKETLVAKQISSWPLLVKPFRKADFLAAIDALLHPVTTGSQ
jgi:two-component SAPR family response regulator